MPVVVAQLLETRSSNPVIVKICIEHLPSTVLKRQKIRKRGQQWSIFKKHGSYIR